jgi:hypothetical protein
MLSVQEKPPNPWDPPREPIPFGDDPEPPPPNKPTRV